MNKIQKTAKNMGVLFTSQIFSYLIGFLYLMYTARYLGVEGFGILSFAIALTGIFAILADLGLNMVMVREISRDKSLAMQYLGNVIIIKIILAVFTFAALILTVNILNYPALTREVVYLITFFVVFGSITGIFYSIFQANERMEFQSVGQILDSVLMFSGALLIIYLGYDVVGFAMVYLVVSSIIMVYSMLICFWKFTLPKIAIDWLFWKYIIKEALPFAATSMFVVIYYYIDTVLLSVMVPNANQVVGWYSAAYKIVMFLSFIPGVYFLSIFPAMSNFFKNSTDSLKFAFERSIKYMAMLGIPIAVGITLLADKIILLVYGEAYIPAVIALQILVWSVVLIFIDSAFSYLFSSINRQITVAKIMGIVALVNVGLNIIIIPYYSYVGASLVTLSSDLITLVLMVMSVSKTHYKVPISSVKNVVKVFFSSMVMAFCIILLGNLNLFIIILVATGVFIACFLLVKGMDDDDISIIKTLLSKKF
jgi:O-antigen/teichoic acid export membrane protein